MQADPAVRAAPLDRKVRIIIAGLGVTQIIGWGSTYYLLTILGSPMSAALDLPPALVSGGMSLLLVLGGLTGPFAGRFMDRRGARPGMAAGSIIAAAGLALLSQAVGPVSYIVAWFVIGLSASLILYPAAFTALTQAAPQNARRAITLLTLPGGLASTVFWPLTSHLMPLFDWREICLIYAGLNLCVCLPIHLLLLPTRAGGLPSTATQASADSEGLPPAAQRRAFVLFAAMLALNALLVTGMLNQIMVLLTGLGQPAEQAVLFAMIFGISQLSARMVDILAAHRTDALRTGVAVMTGFCLALAGLLVAGASPVAGLLFAVLFGASNGILTIIRGTLVLQLFGITGYGEKLGTITVAQGIAGASGPVLIALFLETFGPGTTVTACMGIAVLGLLAMLALYRHVMASRRMVS
ncbi:MAG: MFS transporter [Proteobacteria bacterium]|nr:MFS transporter [Pseudomonadota bacterium]